MMALEIDAALDYLQRGWSVVPVPCGQKKPSICGWQNFSATTKDMPHLFGNGANIAVRLGSKSGDLVDTDLDSPEALELADVYLPTTIAQFGRLLKPRSHRLFIAPGAMFEAFADPISGEMLVELRADGREGGAHLSLFPPSVAGGERREWHGERIDPAAVDARVLRRRVAWLAIGCLVHRYLSHSAAQHPAPDFPRLLWEFDRELGRAGYRWLGEPDPDAPRRDPRRRDELSQRDIDLTEIVRAIPNNCGWEEWNKVGMAIYVASDGSGDGFVIFDVFSAKSPKYDLHAVRERWCNYRRSPPSRIGMGTLVHLARQVGWTSNSRAAS